MYFISCVSSFGSLSKIVHNKMMNTWAFCLDGSIDVVIIFWCPNWFDCCHYNTFFRLSFPSTSSSSSFSSSSPHVCIRFCNVNLWSLSDPHITYETTCSQAVWRKFSVSVFGLRTRLACHSLNVLCGAQCHGLPHCIRCFFAFVLVFFCVFRYLYQ